MTPGLAIAATVGGGISMLGIIWRIKRKFRAALAFAGAMIVAGSALLPDRRSKTPASVATVPLPSTMPVPAPSPDRLDAGEPARPEHSSMVAAPAEDEQHASWESRKGYP